MTEAASECWSCGAALRAEANFCSACGKPPQRCWKCKQSLSPEARVCNGCGSQLRHCWKCHAVMNPESKFCTACGQASRTHGRKALQAQNDARTERNRAVGAMGAVFALVLLGLVIAALLHPDTSADTSADTSEDVAKALPPPSVAWALLGMALHLVAGACGLAILGRAGGWRRSFAGAPTLEDLGWGLAVVVPSLAVAYGWVGLLGSMLPDLPVLEMEISFAVIFVWAVSPALIEEWLCRGVLWESCRGVMSQRMTILTTAILFAMMHGMGGGYVLELPHRFVMGLLLGWLRARSNSLAPCVLAHFTHNLLAILI
ncbi:MAG: CPBP family glutamic-type intramembrane protease [Planctomycetota bacterium]